jgi:hypothetical protein
MMPNDENGGSIKFEANTMSSVSASNILVWRRRCAVFSAGEFFTWPQNDGQFPNFSTM